MGKKIVVICLAVALGLFCAYIVFNLITDASHQRRMYYRYFTLRLYCEIHGEFEVVERHLVSHDFTEVIVEQIDMVYDLEIDLDYFDTLSFFEQSVLVMYRRNILSGNIYIPIEEIPIVFNIPPPGTCICYDHFE